MFTRVTVGRARVVREVRVAAPLMAALRAPVTARVPWLTAVPMLGGGTEPLPGGRPTAGSWRPAGRPDGPGPRVAVEERTQSRRSTVTSRVSSVRACSEPSRISPSARTQPSSGSPSTAAARTRNS
jgi:hypothetical protein